MKKTFILLLTVFFLTCCTSQPPKPPQSNWPVMPMEIDAALIRAMQNITAKFLHRTEKFQSIIEIKADSLRIILLSTSGSRIATITHTNGQLSAETHVKLPVELPLMDILETLQLIYFSEKQLNAHLLTQNNHGWRIKQQKNERNVFFQESLYAQIVYTSANPWMGKTEYHNKKYNYTFTIDSSLLP